MPVGQSQEPNLVLRHRTRVQTKTPRNGAGNTCPELWNHRPGPEGLEAVRQAPRKPARALCTEPMTSGMTWT